jgi:hypothetical protein
MVGHGKDLHRARGCGFEANSVPHFQLLIRAGRSNGTESPELCIEATAYLDSNTHPSDLPRSGQRYDNAEWVRSRREKFPAACHAASRAERPGANRS